MIGLVLQGGGAKGGYQIGVWQALRELNIEIGAVTGTSVGALNGAFIVQNKFDRAYDIWYNMDPRLVIKDEPELYHQLVTRNVDIKNMSMYFDYFAKVVKQKGLDISPLKDLITGEVDEQLMRLSKIDFGLVTVSLTDWKAVEIFIEDIEPGRVGDYMLASAFLPGFKPQMIAGKRFLDGGFYDNLPINLISRRGYTEVVAVELDAIGRIQSVKDKKLNIRRIIPSGDTGTLLEFDKDRSRENIKMGYLDTMKSYGHNEGFLYYLVDVPDESYFYDRMLALSHAQIMMMAGIIGWTEGYPKRLLTEIIVPQLASVLGLDINHTYKDMIVGTIEFLAEAFEVERLQQYKYEELLRIVTDETKAMVSEGTNFEMLPSILRKSNILHKTFKIELLMAWLNIIANT